MVLASVGEQRLVLKANCMRRRIPPADAAEHTVDLPVTRFGLRSCKYGSGDGIYARLIICGPAVLKIHDGVCHIATWGAVLSRHGGIVSIEVV